MDKDEGKLSGVILVRVIDSQARKRSESRSVARSSGNVELSGPGGQDEVREKVERIVLTYSDERAIARYKRVVEPNRGRGGPYIDRGVSGLR
jgi:hypothetical protein